MDTIRNAIMSLAEIREKIGNSKINIPDLQRDYVWRKPEWKRLWDDIVGILSKMCDVDSSSEDKYPQHFVGTLTLQHREDGLFDLLDGQQRFTTISVLIDYLGYCLNNSPVGDELLKNSKVSHVEIDRNNLERNKDIYTEIYRFFMDCHYEMNYGYTSELWDIVNNRLFFLVHVADSNENAHEIFEGINATGKNLDFSDLLLNSLLERNTDKDSKAIKEKWNSFLKEVCGKTQISFTNEEDEKITEEIADTSALKLKKFFNALNSLTLGENIPIQESVSDFNRMVERLGEFGVLSNPVDTSEHMIDTLIKWAEIYSIVVNPTEEWNYAMINERKYAKEVYYLSVWNATAYIPTIMRILYRNLKLNEDEMYSDDVVRNMLKIILALLANTRIILNRVHADDRNLENKIRVIDLIYDAEKNLKSGLNTANDTEKIISAIVNEKIILVNKADDMIRAYQYTSAGSKFLLTLYVDAKFRDDGVTVLKLESELESEYGKAQVEHMVAQNLEEDFENYGFSVSTVGLLDNLILLSGHANQSISSKGPEEKLETWKEDPFGKLFVEKNVELPDVHSEFREYQKDKVANIVTAFIEYFKPLSEETKQKNLTLTFARKEYRNGRYEKLFLLSDSALKSGEADSHYLRINKNKYEENPRSNDNSTQGCYYADNVTAPIRQPEELSTNSIIGKFCELMGKKELYLWLRECEDSIDRANVKNGSNKVKFNNKEFVYSQKMLHTIDLENDKKFENVLSRGTKTAYKLTVENGQAICISNDFNISDCIPYLIEIYDNFNKRPGFGFWIKMVKKKPVWVDNILIQTEYINIGDKNIYTSFLKEKYKDIFDNIEKNTNNADSEYIDKIGQKISSYFEYRQMSFVDLSKLSDIRIPEYQRAYVWDEGNWSALLSRIRSHSELFLGTIVIRKEKDAFYIVDGQQRLTTLTGFYIGQNKEAHCPEILKKKSEDNGVPKFIENYKDIIDFNSLLFDVIIISDNADRTYQYEVFSSINSAGRKLTEEEKIANYLFSRYGQDKYKGPEAIREIAHNPGFAKAFCECMSMKNCRYEDIYSSFKRIVEEKNMDFEQLYSLSNIFSYIKGNKNINVFENNEYPIWLELINALEVTTADSLMLNWASRILFGDSENKYSDFEKLTKKICILYFLLYVMDRSGNAKKSANLNFIKCIKTDGPLVKQVINSQADLPYWNGRNSSAVAADIWKNYILSLPIYDIGQANIKRFILLMLEYILIDEADYTAAVWKENVINQGKLDIEHIFPAGEKNWPEEKQDLISISRLNYLENVMLLENEINRSVKDKMLHEKVSNGDKGYKQSKVFMAEMLCNIANTSKVYTVSLATKRLNDLWNKGEARFKLLIEDVMARADCKMADIDTVNIASTVNELKPVKKKITSPKGNDIGVQNLKLVIQYTLANADLLHPENLKSFSDCRKLAVNSVVELVGKGSKYKSTVLDQITRRIGLSINDFDEALFDHLNGKENENYEIIRGKIEG